MTGMRGVHLCSFQSTEHLRGKALTYEAVKAAVLAAGRFSVFEASASTARAKLFTRLCQDPELEIDNTCGYPWTLVRRKGER